MTTADLSRAAREINDILDRFQPEAADVAGTRSSVPIAAYRERLIDLDRLVRQLQELGFHGLQLARLVHSARLDRARAWTDLARDYLLRAYERGFVDRPALRAGLLALGLGDAEVELEEALAAMRLALQTDTPPPVPDALEVP